MIKDTILDLLEYTLIFAFIWLFWQGKMSPTGTKAIIVYTVIGLFFLVSGGAWLLRDVKSLKEYQPYKLWLELLAFLIGLISLIYLVML